MTVHTHTLQVFLDRKGNLEIEGLLHGTSESDTLADTLGIEHFESLGFLCSSVRAEGLDQATMDRVRAWVQESGHDFEEKDDLGPVRIPDAEDRPDRTGDVAADASHEARRSEIRVRPDRDRAK